MFNKSVHRISGRAYMTVFLLAEFLRGTTVELGVLPNIFELHSDADKECRPNIQTVWMVEGAQYDSWMDCSNVTIQQERSC